MKTNLEMIRELDEVYTPERKHIVSVKEIDFISKHLCLNKMDKLQMFNLRDILVMWYSAKINNDENDYKLKLTLMDKMSAIVCVIDSTLYNRYGNEEIYL